eukprot:CAMPEP_0181535134 /NCGR_PEP_ID=MMETSP1110-20121109/74100_1 /TAXON_ID=174948 /ORGANISM="Symbiodinium sp., Strain CCMP421" /LENGTH=43 /DNA_ID= /DNA_START= /DNA_END= /DNA_ORIENTATION=
MAFTWYGGLKKSEVGSLFQMSLLPGHKVPVNIGMVEEEDGVIR